MSKYLHLSKTNCKHCYKCIRHCPVKAISFSSDSAHVEILPDDCILCGECYTNCPQHAKNIQNDVDAAKKLIAGENKVYASIFILYGRGCFGCCIRFDLVTQMAGYRMGTSPRQRVFRKDV